MPILCNALIILLLAASSCKDDSVVFVCPDGTEMTGGICCPPGTVGQGGFCVENPDSGVRFSPKDIHGSTAEDASADATDPTVDAQQKPQEILETTGAVGAPCLTDDQCTDDGACLSWPGGYCTFLGCGGDSTLCPEDSACASTGNATTCLRSCEDYEDCRSDEGYGCKTVPSASGDQVSVCYGLDENAGDIGAPCATHTGCQGAATCYTGVSGGICALDNCTVGSCPEQTRCVMLDGVPRCLKKCNFDGECSEAGVARTCEELTTPPGASVHVCFVPQGTEPTGAECTGGYACASSFCRIVAKGVCSFDAEQGCLANPDCPEGQICIVSTQYFRGVCSEPCSTSACTGAAACLIDDQNQGWCTALCDGDDDPTCNFLLGTQCLFGTAVGTSVGKYFCSKALHPGPMTPCATDEPCGLGGQCLLAETEGTNAGGADATPSSSPGLGYCLVPCDTTGSCAFPGQCLAWGDAGDYFCMRPCNTANQCPENMTCPVVQGNIRACRPSP